jgi:hypothetical protein
MERHLWLTRTLQGSHTHHRLLPSNAYNQILLAAAPAPQLLYCPLRPPGHALTHAAPLRAAVTYLHLFPSQRQQVNAALCDLFYTVALPAVAPSAQQQQPSAAAAAALQQLLRALLGYSLELVPEDIFSGPYYQNAVSEAGLPLPAWDGYQHLWGALLLGDAQELGPGAGGWWCRGGGVVVCRRTYCVHVCACPCLWFSTLVPVGVAGVAGELEAGAEGGDGGLASQC